MRRLYLLMVLLTILPILFLQVRANPGLVEQQVYRVGDAVHIYPPEGITQRVVIEGVNAKYQLLDPPTGVQTFTPPTPGTYNVSVYDKDAALLMSASFEVIEQPVASTYSIHLDPLQPHANSDVMVRLTPTPPGEVDIEIRAPSGTFHYVGPWHDAPFRPKESGRHEVIVRQGGLILGQASFDVLPASEHLISTTKDSYGPDEAIDISLGPGAGSDYTILITSGERTSRYLGTDLHISFFPLASGPQLIQAIGPDGRILDELVVDAASSELPIASNGFLLEDHAGRQRVVSSTLIQGRDRMLVELERPIAPINSVRFESLDQDILHRLRIEEVPDVRIGGKAALQSFAIDPTDLNFTSATISANAKGNSLWKCKNYSFGTQACLGGWEFVRGLDPGQEYRFTLTPEDPLFSEQNTTSCSCSDSVTSQNSGTLQCSITCTHTINIPATATSFRLEQLKYNVGFTATTDSTTFSNADQRGYYDHDTTHFASTDDIFVGRGTSAASTTFTWTNSSIPSSGSRSFTNLDCSNWPNYCTYNIYLNASVDFQAPGNSKKSPSMSLSMNYINYTINYTVPGPFSVTLNYPTTNTRTRNTRVTFNFTPTVDTTSLVNCSLYTNASGWSIKNTTFAPQDDLYNYLQYTFSTDGSYLWNVLCFDDSPASIWGINNLTLFIDTTPPTVSLRTPADGSTQTSSSVVTFVYNVSDASPIANCSLYVDNVLRTTDTSVSKDTNQSFSYYLANGVYDWTVSCSDTPGNRYTAANFTINVSVAPTIYTGQWFETDTQDCTSPTCQISLAQQTDGTTNSLSYTMPASTTITEVNATSPYLGSNGGHIASGSTVSFSSFFNTADGNLNARWYVYVLSSGGARSPVCNNTAGTAVSGGAASTGTCSPGSNIRMTSTDRFLYQITMQNTHPSQTRAFDHTIDHASSYFNAAGFSQIGIISASLLYPLQPLTTLQGNSFNVSCSVTCTLGYCLNTNVYVQQNSSGTWTDIGASGYLRLNTSETNPHALGNVFNTTTTTLFRLNATTAGTGSVRCRAASTYQSATTSSTPVTVLNSAAPTVSLTWPPNNKWVGNRTINFTYVPSTLGTLTSCTLLLNGSFSQNNQSVLINGASNFFTRTLAETRYNWSVTCNVTGQIQGNSSVRYLDVDSAKPYRIDLNAPEAAFNTTQPEIVFNWTAYDARSPNMTCQLLVNDTVRDTRTSFDGIATNTTVAGFSIGNYRWYVRCTDLAGNLNSSVTRFFSVSDEPPTASLISPPDNGAVNTTNVEFVYTASDNFALANCSLYINGLYNQSNQSVLINGVHNFTAPLTQETYYNWSVSCSDSAKNNVTTANYTFRVDVTKPIVSLSTPANYSNFSTNAIVFQYTATDVASPLACVVYVDNVANITSSATSGVLKTENGAGYRDGVHDWNVTCADDALNTNTSETWIFNVSQYPKIVQNSPPNGKHVKGSNIFLRYTPSDNDGFLNCSLSVNGTFNQTNATVLASGVAQNFTLVSPRDGYYLWSAACVDAGVYSNTNATQNRSFVVDNTLPNIQLYWPPNEGIINTSTIPFNWTATDNLATHLSCSLTVNSSVNVSGLIRPNGGLWNTTVTGFFSADYNWSVTCLDNATNQNTSAHWNFTVRIPPIVNLTYPEDNKYDVLSTIQFRYIPSSGTGNYINCSLYLNGVRNQTNSSIVPNAVNNFTAQNLPDGRYDWNVSCIDTNKLEGFGSGRTYFVDTNPPYNVSLLIPANESVVTRNNVTFTFEEYDAISPNATCTLYLNDGGWFPLATNLNVTNATPYQYRSQLTDGQYQWNVTCIDIAGNEGTAQFIYNFTVLAPPNVTLLAPPNPTWNNTGDIVFTYRPDDDIQVKNCSLYLNGVRNSSDVTVFNHLTNSFALNGMGAGRYNWTVGCFDPDDNFYSPANRTLVIDYGDPYISLNGPTPSITLLTSSVVFNYTALDDFANTLACDLRINGTINTSATVTNGIPYNKTIEGFTDGSFAWNVSCVDQATNANTSLTRTFSVQEAPKILLRGPPNSTRTANTSIDFNFVGRDNSGKITGCFVTWDSQANSTNTTPIVNTALSTISANGLDHGTHTWNVNCTDPSGNQGRNSTGYSIDIDLQGPNITLIAPTPSETFNKNNITFNWTATDFPGSTIICNLSVTNTSGTLVRGPFTKTSGSPFNATIANLDDGSHDWNVTCIDDLGNRNTSALGSFVINQPDLFLSGPRLSFSDSNPSPGQQISIRANVSNIGGIDAIGANVSFWDGDPQAGGQYLGSQTQTVSFNSSKIFQIAWNITAGYHTIYVSADPADLIGELNETNNNASISISYILVNITQPPNATKSADTTPQISFNITDFTSNNLTYRIYSDSTYLGLNGSVAPNSDTSRNLTALTDGIHLIRVEARDSLNRRKNSTALTLIIDTTPPTTAFTTANASWYASHNVSVRFISTDTFSNSISYKVFLDGILDRTNTTTNGTPVRVNFTGQAEGSHVVIIEGTDDLGNVGNSTAFVFYVDVTPPSPNITTTNDTWFNTATPQIGFNITDNLDPVLNYTFYADAIKNQNGTVPNGVLTNVNLLTLSEGIHTLLLQGLDEAGNAQNSTPRRIIVDLTAPTVSLLSPANDSSLTVTSSTLNFTASDNLAAILLCSVRLDGAIINASLPVAVDTNRSVPISGLTTGFHYWNVTCVDNATNAGVSQTWRFYVEAPDFVVTAGNITLSNATPIENQTITINATIFNIGNLDAINVTVQFYSGDPSGTGVQIGTNRSILSLPQGANATVSMNYTVTLGLNQLYVVVDPPTDTGGSHVEENESNNKAHLDLWVGLYEIFAGVSSNELHIADASIAKAFTWNQTNVSGSNVFVADADSSVTFTSLVALGRNTSDGLLGSIDDFVQLDSKLNMSGLNESINSTWTSGGSPKDTISIVAYKQSIPDIPVVNSTNTSNFRTGILWDSSDGGSSYDTSQDVVFLTVMNASKPGQYGIYDYEIRIPAKLRDYIAGGNKVAFYTELR